MKKIHLFLMIVAVASVGAVGLSLDSNSNVVTSQKQVISVPNAFAANPYDCSMNTIDTESITAGYNTPKSVPEGYGIKDSFTNIGEVGLFFATGDMCGPNATQKSLADGVIMYYTANRDSDDARIADPERHFDVYKTNSDYPDRITLTRIAGHPAMLWDSGIEKNVYILENGEIFAEEDSPYPAQITVVDKENGELYMVRGYVPLDTLENMIKSAITPKAP